MKKILLKKLMALAAAAAMMLNAFPAFAEGETIDEVLTADNTVVVTNHLTNENWLNGVNGVQFGKTSIHVQRYPVYVWFELHDINAIEKLSLKLNVGTNDINRPDRLTAYTLTDVLPDIGSKGSYSTESSIYTAWNDFVTNNLTALEKNDIITFVPDSSTKYSEMDITKLISDTDKNHGYLLIKLNNGSNVVNHFENSSLSVIYNSAALTANQEGYLTALNEAMSADDIKTAAEGSSGMYFDVDSAALTNMTDVYKALFQNMPKTGYTKESFKTAFDEEVNKYLTTKEFMADYILSFLASTSTNSAFKFAVSNAVNTMYNPLIGVKIDNTYAVKSIALSMVPSYEGRKISITNAYMVDEVKTGTKASYTTADDSENEVYKFWSGLRDNYQISEVIGMSNNSFPYVLPETANSRLEADLTDYTAYTLNKYGKDKYMFLRLSSPNLTIQTGNADITKAIKFIVTYDTTAINEQKELGWNAISTAMERTDIKTAIETYGEGMGLDYITKISKDYIYDDLLAALDECSDADTFCKKAQDIYTKYVSVRNILPCEEIMYNNNYNQIKPANGYVSIVERYIGQYSSSDLGDGKNIICADFTVTTHEENTYNNSMFVRTITPVAFDGFDPANSYTVAGDNADSVAAAGTDSTIFGDQWKYASNAKAVSRIKFAAGTEMLESNITENLKEKLANGDTKVAYTLGVEEQNGSAKLAKINDKYSAIKVTFDRTANEDAALTALKNASSPAAVLEAIKKYSIEFNVSATELEKLDETSTAVGDELLTAFASVEYQNIFEAEETFDTLIANIKDTMIKYEITDASYADGKFKANVKKLSEYAGDMKVIFVSYKNNVMNKLVLADDTAVSNLKNLEKDASAEISVDTNAEDYDIFKVIIIDSFNSLEPLAYVMTK